MRKKNVNNRQYDSSYRQAQARLTRKKITEAAYKLFLKRGYAGATITAIAKEAKVSTETIYATFNNKRGILAHLVNVSVVGDEDDEPLLKRPFVKATASESDQHKQIARFAQQMSDIMGRMAPIFEIMRTAAKTEADIAEMRDNIMQERKLGMAYFVSSVATHGGLRDGLMTDKAAEIVFALSSGEMFNVFIQDLGWSKEQYILWLTDALTDALLPA
jgi:AcrR family transcriptional regulator